MKFSSVIAIIASSVLLSMVSCNKPSDGSDGLVFMWFDVSGKTVDSEGMPVSGISVFAESATSVKTDADGNFTISGGGVPAESAVIRFVDDDNLGKKYTSRVVVVALEKYKDGHGWNQGYYRNSEEVIVTLTEDVDVKPLDPDNVTGQEEEQ